LTAVTSPEPSVSTVAVAEEPVPPVTVTAAPVCEAVKAVVVVAAPTVATPPIS